MGKGANPAAIFSGGFGRFREFRGCHARAVSGASGVNGLNKPFKDGVRKKWMQWMADGIHKFTATGRQKKPSEELICSWISETWNDISAEMITTAFQKCGITNSLDGSENDMVYVSTEDTNEPDHDDSFVRELFTSDSEAEFEGFVI